MPSPISVYFVDTKLAKTLSSRLAAATGRDVAVVDNLLTALDAPGLLVTSTTQCSPAECAGIAEVGHQVIVLAAVPSAFQKQVYENAGASAYLPMSLDLEPLTEAISQVEAGFADSPLMPSASRRTP